MSFLKLEIVFKRPLLVLVSVNLDLFGNIYCKTY